MTDACTINDKWHVNGKWQTIFKYYYIILQMTVFSPFFHSDSFLDSFIWLWVHLSNTMFAGFGENKYNFIDYNFIELQTDAVDLLQILFSCQAPD